MYKESETIELKSSFGEWREMIISLCAFANKNGGSVIVGIDESGEPTGVVIGKGSLEDIANKIKLHTDPPLYPSINVKTFGPAEIIEITVSSSDNKPVFAFDKAYARVGRTNQKLSNNAVRELIKRFTLPDHDEMVIDEKIKNIEFDEKLISEMSKKIFGKETEGIDLLHRLKLVRKDKITRAGYLCFVKTNRLLPNAVVKAARFKGNNTVKFIDMKDIDSNILLAVDESLDFIKRHTNMGVVIADKARRRELWDYPDEALRESIINAVVHRDYADPGNVQIRIFDERLEVWSPGLLPKEIRINNLLTENRSIPRNKTIAKIFHDAGMIEGWGTGFQRMVDACLKNNKKRPEFVEKTGAFICRFNGKRLEGINEGINEGIGEGIGEGINRLCEFITNNPGRRVINIAKELAVPEKTVERWIKELKALDKIVYKGSKKTGGYYKT